MPASVSARLLIDGLTGLSVADVDAGAANVTATPVARLIASTVAAGRVKQASRTSWSMAEATPR